VELKCEGAGGEQEDGSGQGSGWGSGGVDERGAAVGGWGGRAGQGPGQGGGRGWVQAAAVEAAAAEEGGLWQLTM
jgi:hypothetical protein